jgi:GntR family transcriptional regulator/MocR family aminotransferase
MDLRIFQELRETRVTSNTLQDAIAIAIQQGKLLAGEKLPSTRELAIYFEVSRTTVVKAFDALIAKGIICSSHGSGTWVSKHAGNLTNPEEALVSANHEAAYSYDWIKRYSDLSKSLNTLGAEHAIGSGFDSINYGSAPLETLSKQWRKKLLVCSDSSSSLLESNREVFGYRPLREAIAGFLRRSKGMICDAEQIVLQSGVQSVVSPIFYLLVKPSDIAVCQQPVFFGIREQFESIGAHVLNVPADMDGMVINELYKLEQHANWLYIMPSCHEPLGLVLSLERRKSLLQWSKQNQTAIIEDDWDSEFIYRGKALPTLFSMDTTSSVIYFYSFWRLLYPLASTGFLVIPRKLIPIFESFKNTWDRQFTLVEHMVLTDLINEGHLETHIRATWKHLSKLRSTLMYNMSKSLGHDIAILPSSTGMQITVRFSTRWSRQEIEQAAIREGLPASSTEPFYMYPEKPNEFMIQFANLSLEHVEDMVTRFVKALPD